LKSVEYEEMDSLVQPFSDSLIIIHKAMARTMMGKILWESKQPIIISKNLNLSNIIVKAPYIKIESNFEGNAQFIAEDSIVVGEHVRLKFPSALIIESDKIGGFKAIKIGADSDIQGLIQMNAAQEDFEKTFCVFAENCKITGEVLVNGIISVKNLALDGRVSTYKFITSLGDSYYHNTLIDTKIDGEILTKKSLFIQGSNAKTLFYVD
jgi:hypothetical protein